MMFVFAFALTFSFGWRWVLDAGWSLPIVEGLSASDELITGEFRFFGLAWDMQVVFFLFAARGLCGCFACGGGLSLI
ncbi:hypothetical protein [Paraburkholderia domus]|uniref:hypothetical protein n=1 Tax=Paraburkholderia domus TaxID=2793075 RepID=UPI001B0846DE|nr:hypothetical protein [Paraburkholderia domus]CAE6802576.1 hypothetical protein R75483_05413 [Paraburkholderia domus]